MVPDVRSVVDDHVGGGTPRPLRGRDGISSIHVVGDHVVKIRPAGPFEASVLIRALRDVHAALAPAGLAPRLHLSCHDGRELATVTSLVHARDEPPTPGQVGAGLARCHRILSGIPARASLPWVGSYGERLEFEALLPALDDAELSSAGRALLAHAERGRDPGPVHYVHRDLHPGNVLAGERGVCFVDWDLVHVGAALDDLAMTLIMWAAETPSPVETAVAMLAGYHDGGGERYDLNHPRLRAAIAVCGLRQGVGGWFTDRGRCTAPYWPYIRARTRVSLELLRHHDERVSR